MGGGDNFRGPRPGPKEDMVCGIIALYSSVILQLLVSGSLRLIHQFVGLINCGNIGQVYQLNSCCLMVNCKVAIYGSYCKGTVIFKFNYSFMLQSSSCGKQVAYRVNVDNFVI